MTNATYIFAALIALTLFGHVWATIPAGLPIREEVSLIEVNHFYDEQGRLVFDQVIFYDWSERKARYDVRAWRLIKSQDQLPRKDWQRGGYVTTWKDEREGREVIRCVRSPSVRETWLQHDPELAERDVLPKERRRELAKR